MNSTDKNSSSQFDGKKLNSPLSRREMIKVSGLLALGLAYSKPFVETVQARPAFDADMYNAGKP